MLNFSEMGRMTHCSGMSHRGSLPAATGALGAGLGGLLEHVLVEVHELDHGHLGAVTQAVAELEDAAVAAGTVGYLVGYCAEELLDGLLVLQVAEDEAAVGSVVGLGAGDDGLAVDTQCLGLGQSRGDALVHDQRDGHVGKHGLAVGRLTTEVVEFFIVSHWWV